jgi:chemotaxis protein histidine kinase CheA
VEDITEQLNLSKELEKQEAAAEEKLQLILQILRVEPTVLREFLRRFREGLETFTPLLQSEDGGDLHDKIHHVFRTVHTLKGESALLQLSLFERPLHKLEDGLAALRDNPELNSSHLTSIAPAIATLKELNENVASSLAHLDQLSPKSAASPGEPPPPVRQGPLTLANRMVEDLSERLAKPVSFHSAVRDEDLPEAYREVINELLLHLVRNSMVHGIEPTAIREARGKSAVGTLQFAIKPHPDFHEIIFQDDGAGLNYERIRHRAAQMGRILSTPEEFHDAIFIPGFSTAENVSDLAGRGVGLDAIRHSVLQSGGSIHVYSEEGSYCAFQVLLPKTTRRAA